MDVKEGGEATWKLWYQDSFDRECPRQVELEGVGLPAGLYQLWAHHLRESILENGGEGFSHFDLWWEQEKTSIRIAGNREGQVKLRNWIYKEKADEGLLMKIATSHQNLVHGGETCEQILEVAAAADNFDDFLEQLDQYV